MPKAKKTSSPKDLKSLEKWELQKELEIARKELYTLEMKHSLSELKQSHLLKKQRRTIAQISTYLNSSL